MQMHALKAQIKKVIKFILLIVSVEAA